MEWKIGCFTRPYQPHGLQRALEGISGAGYKYVGLMGKGFFPPSLTEPQLKELSRMLSKYGLKPVVTWGEFAGRTEAGAADLKKVIDNAVKVGFDRILMAGPWPYLEGINVIKPTSKWIQEIEEFFEWIKGVSSYAGKKAVKIVLKPHGGITGTAKECLETMERINSENVRIWYDTGNVVFYEGLRPQDVPDDLKVILDYVDGVCIKDTTGGRGGKGSCAPGLGVIDLKTVFQVLKEADFKGPCVVEFGIPAETPVKEIDSLAQSGHKHVKKILSEL